MKFDRYFIAGFIVGAFAFLGMLAMTQYASAEAAVVTFVKPNYKQVTQTVPVESCSVEQVPIYAERKGQGATGLDVLFGALFGGLAGKALTDKDEGAAAGAVIGGVVAAEAGRATQLEIVGYEDQEICMTRYVERTGSMVKDYTVRFEWNGHTGRGTTKTPYQVGDPIDVVVTLSICRSLDCN